MMLRGLDLLRDSPGINDTATQAFATLSGRQSRAWPAPQYVRAQRVEGLEAEGTKRIRPAGGIGEAVYAFGVARGGDYRLRLHLAAPGRGRGRVHRGRLRRGAALVQRARGRHDGLGRRRIAAPRPGRLRGDGAAARGQPARVRRARRRRACTRSSRAAAGSRPRSRRPRTWRVTVLQALDLESELPPAAPPLEYRGSDLQLEDGSRTVAASGEGGFRGGPRGSRVVLVVDIPETGLYSLSVFGTGSGGQRWLADGCRIEPDLPQHRSRGALARRAHRRLPEGPALLLREPRARHGGRAAAFRAEEGHAGRLPRDRRAARPRARRRRVRSRASKAEEARRFLERRRSQRERDLCGDILRPGTLVAELTLDVSGSQAGGGGEGGGGGRWRWRRRRCGGGEPPPPPIIPPLPPAHA